MESNAAAGRSLRYAAIMNRSNILKAYSAAFLKNLQFFGPISVPYFLDWLRVDYTKMFILLLVQLRASPTISPFVGDRA